MINEIAIENYKSVRSLQMNLGRLTVLIGANGCGKSNILEALALCSAAATNKLDHEFLVSRGIRLPDDTRLMRSAFDVEQVTKDIKISVAHRQTSLQAEKDQTSLSEFECILRNRDNSPYSNWVDVGKKSIGQISEVLEYLQKLSETGGISSEMEVKFEHLKPLFDKQIEALCLKDFLIYSPENSSLRTFETEGQIQPLGIKGEGLFKLLTVLNTKKNKGRLTEIKEELRLLDWFRDFDIPKKLSVGEKNLLIKDKYLDEELAFFNQKSSNEGFLFLLFYFCLLISDQTPDFFAIDNVDASLNPKLCSRLLQELARLSKKYDKQVIVTTHNPAILDGIDLTDDEQKLFVIYRNKLGHTKANEICKRNTDSDETPVRLSEAFLRGYLGGLPKNF